MQVTKSNRLSLINKDLQDCLVNKRILVQQPGFDHLEVFSPNQKVNSVIRTLIALHGRHGLFQAVHSYLRSSEGEALTGDEAWEVFQAAKWAVCGEDQ